MFPLFRTRNIAIALLLAVAGVLAVYRARSGPRRVERPTTIQAPLELPTPTAPPAEEQQLVSPTPSPSPKPEPTPTPTPTPALEPTPERPPEINLYRLPYPGRTAVVSLPPMPLILDLYQPPVTEMVTLPLASRFDFPLGTSNGGMVYNAQPFGKNRHLGDDWNGLGGYDTDLGESVHAIATGRIVLAAWLGGEWGNVVIIQHAYMHGEERVYVQSLYAHLQKIFTRAGKLVRRGARIGTVGNADGRFYAHLHLEMRAFSTLYIGGGYRARTDGWFSPTNFIREHRGAVVDDFSPELQ